MLFNLTKRQLFCFSVAALIGVPSFFLIRRTGNMSLASLGMILTMLPFFFLAMYERDGMPPEVLLQHFQKLFAGQIGDLSGQYSKGIAGKYANGGGTSYLQQFDGIPHAFCIFQIQIFLMIWQLRLVQNDNTLFIFGQTDDIQSFLHIIPLCSVFRICLRQNHASIPLSLWE
ncbi:MAG: PrgI family protein [Lactimicrobium massiliense]|nr:PrgI family protein [Lactimicrobium massiliense]MDD6559854.1 PrgI family protein [Lactimicrobium massiliense]